MFETPLQCLQAVDAVQTTDPDAPLPIAESVEQQVTGYSDLVAHIAGPRQETRCLPPALVIRVASRNRILLPSKAWREEESDSRSEEHTSELQSLRHLVCRLLLEKKNTTLAKQPAK